VTFIVKNAINAPSALSTAIIATNAHFVRTAVLGAAVVPFARKTAFGVSNVRSAPRTAQIAATAPVRGMDEGVCPALMTKAETAKITGALWTNLFVRTVPVLQLLLLGPLERSVYALHSLIQPAPHAPLNVITATTAPPVTVIVKNATNAPSALTTANIVTNAHFAKATALGAAAAQVAHMTAMTVSNARSALNTAKIA
jgi:hypothetical protein